MRREIFGPILPVRAYSDRQEVADYINGHDRPLAIYPFTNNRELRDYYISRVMSGGVSVNEALLHVPNTICPSAAFGEAAWGTTTYEGFITFSKLRPVFYQGPFSAIQMLLQPPYAGRATKFWLESSGRSRSGSAPGERSGDAGMTGEARMR